MDLCATDLKSIIRLLSRSAILIDGYCVKPREQDVARQCRQMVKKLTRKLDYVKDNPTG